MAWFRQLPQKLDRAAVWEYAVFVVFSPSESMRVLVPVAAISLLLTISGCEVSTSATIHSGPAFSLEGSGRLVSFRVYGPQIGRKIATPNDEKSLVWSIKPITGDAGALVARMEVVYGAVPRGYAQAVSSERLG